VSLEIHKNCIFLLSATESLTYIQLFALRKCSKKGRTGGLPQRQILLSRETQKVKAGNPTNTKEKRFSEISLPQFTDTHSHNIILLSYFVVTWANKSHEIQHVVTDLLTRLPVAFNEVKVIAGLSFLEERKSEREI